MSVPDPGTESMTAIRILGIDPGSRVTGVGVVELEGHSLRHIHSACIRAGEGELGSRLAAIYRGVSGVIQDWEPESAAVERVFLASNPHAALILGHARGSAMLAAVNHGLPISEYSALEIKRSVVGTGSAAKEQVQHMVRVLLGMDYKPPVDAADALACAICHLHTAEGERRVQSGRQRVRG